MHVIEESWVHVNPQCRLQYVPRVYCNSIVRSPRYYAERRKERFHEYMNLHWKINSWVTHLEKILSSLLKVRTKFRNDINRNWKDFCNTYNSFSEITILSRNLVFLVEARLKDIFSRLNKYATVGIKVSLQSASNRAHKKARFQAFRMSSMRLEACSNYIVTG